jgi:hypothetical protein
VFNDRQHHDFAARVGSGVVDAATGDAYVADVVASSALTAGKTPWTVEVVSHGRTIERSVLYAHGESTAPEEFRMTDSELAEKSHNFMSGQLSRKAIDDVVQAAFRLDTERRIDTLMEPIRKGANTKA